MKEKIAKLEEELENAVNNDEFSKLQQEAMQAKEEHEILQREHKLIVTAMYNMGLELFKYRSGQLDVNSLLSNSGNSLKTSTNTISAPLSSSSCAPTDDSAYEDLNQTMLTLNDTSEESPKMTPAMLMPPPTVTKPSLQSVSKVANSVRKPLQTLKHNEVANTPRVQVKSKPVAPTTNKRLTLAERALQVRNGGSGSTSTTSSAAVGSKRKLDDDIDLVPSSSVKRQRITMK